MATNQSLDKKGVPKRILRAFIPLWCWIPVSILLLGYNFHRINAPKTFIQARVILNGEPLNSIAQVAMHVDGVPWTFSRQPPIPIGDHKITITLPDATTFQTNLFVWYGENQLGEISLYRQRGELELNISPMADKLELKGEYADFNLYRTSGLRTNLPVGDYDILLKYGDNQDRYSVKVDANRLNSKTFRGNYGFLELSANPSDAGFRVQNSQGTKYYLNSGTFPQSLTLPTGDYSLLSTRGNYRKETQVSITRGTTNSFEVLFDYGTFDITTVPPAASVKSDGKMLGTTPLEVSLIPGSHQIRLDLDGYNTATFPITLEANQTIAIKTNLVHRGLADAIKNANRSAEMRNYRNAIIYLKSALEIDPESSELKAQLAEYESIQADQNQKQRIADRARNAATTFNAVVGKIQHAELFDTHLWTFQNSFDEVNRAVRKTIEDGPGKYSLESESPVGEGNMLFNGAVKGLRSLGQRCVVLVTELQPDQVQVQAKFWDFVTGKKITLSFSGIDPSSLIPVHERYFQANQRASINQRRKETAESFQTALQNQLN